jgi:hypothetical protein
MSAVYTPPVIWPSGASWQRLLALWALTGLALAWPHLAPRWRRLSALLVGASGLGLLVVAMRTEGVRESSTLTTFLFSNPYVTAQTEASASLPYYLLTALCLALGAGGLVIGERAIASLASRPVWNALGLALLLCVVRFLLEKAAAPPALAELFGVTWSAPVVGAYLASTTRLAQGTWRAVLGACALYAWASRALVATLYLLATWLALGSHYDVGPLVLVRDPFTQRVLEFAPRSGAQMLALVLVPQLVFWPLVTLLAALLGAALAALVLSPRGRRALPRRPTLLASEVEDI